jgi:hypothetical protein
MYLVIHMVCMLSESNRVGARQCGQYVSGRSVLVLRNLKVGQFSQWSLEALGR